MKKYNGIIVLSVLVYLFLAFSAGYKLNRTQTDQAELYKVEINRIYNSLSKDLSLDKLDLGSYTYVRQVSYLSAENNQPARRTQKFYEEGNQWDLEIRPLFRDGKAAGYLRFDYLVPAAGRDSVFLILQVCLGIMELFLLAVLFYLKVQLIAPFSRLSNLPYELSKGHLTDVVTEEKSCFFGYFIRGIGQLKDTLAVAKKREMELEKEKKKMLLSLSHDMKTPLHTLKLYGKALEEGLYTEEGQKVHAARQIGEKAAEIERYIGELIKSSQEDILDIQVNNTGFYLNALMKKVLDTYGEKCRLHLVELEVDKYENLLLRGDLERSAEVMENILENALKYGDGGTIRISFYEEDYCHLIRIYNTGTPVTDNEFNHVFESFFRGSNSKGMQGSGLGLYICREIMRKMEGEIFALKDAKGMAFVLVFQ